MEGGRCVFFDRLFSNRAGHREKMLAGRPDDAGRHPAGLVGAVRDEKGEREKHRAFLRDRRVARAGGGLLAFPFIQTAMQGSISNGDSNAPDTTNLKMQDSATLFN